MQSPLLTAILSFALLLVPLSAPRAQEEVDTEALVTQADGLLAEIQETSTQMGVLAPKMDAASGTQRAVLRQRVVTLRLEGLADLDALIANVEEQKEHGLDVTRYENVIVPVVEGIGPGLQRLVSEQTTRIAELVKERQESGATEIGKLELEILEERALLLELEKAAVGQLDRVEALGMDPGPLAEFLPAHLTEETETIAARVQVGMSRIGELAPLVEKYPEDAELKKELRNNEEALGINTDDLEARVKLLTALDVDVSPYKQILIQATGDLTTDVFDREVASGLLQSWIAELRGWAIDAAPNALFQLIVFIGIIALFRLLSRVAKRLVARAISSFQTSELLQKMVVGMASNVVMILGVLVALSQIGISVGPLLAGLGVAGFIVGFALQETLGNFAAGMMILAYRPFDVGDSIEAAGGVFGQVSHMNLVSTTILTFDNQTLIVPNGKIWGDVIRNVSAQDTRRIDFEFGIGYSDDVVHAEQTLRRIVDENPKVLDDPEPVVRITRLGESSVDFVVRPWVKADDYWDVHGEIMREVKLRFDAEGISIPFPQRDLHVFNEVQNGSAPQPTSPAPPEKPVGDAAAQGADAEDAR